MLGVLADDFSGAAEVAGLAVAAGCEARLETLAAPASAALPRPDLLVIDTDTRSLAPAVAARVVAEALRRLRRAGATAVFKKLDSVLRGPVVAELSGLREAGGYHHVVLLPANPSRGRLIQGGRYLCEGVPLHQAVFGDDPEHPMRTDSVAAILSAAGSRLRFASDADTKPVEGEIVVAEAATAADVERWAHGLHPAALPAGAADFFSAWLAREIPTEGRVRGIAAAQPGIPVSFGLADDVAASSRCDLFVCGSTAAWARGRAADCARNRIPIVRLPPSPHPHDSIRAACDTTTADELRKQLRRAGRAMLTVVGHQPEVTATADASRWTPGARLERLADVVARLLDATALTDRTAPSAGPRIDRVFIEGGMTAAAVARRLNWTTFTALHPVAAGITPLAVASRDAPLLVPKPGSYSWPFLQTE